MLTEAPQNDYIFRSLYKTLSFGTWFSHLVTEGGKPNTIIFQLNHKQSLKNVLNKNFTSFITGQNVVKITLKHLAHHKEEEEHIPSESGVLVIYKFPRLEVSHMGIKDDDFTN